MNRERNGVHDPSWCQTPFKNILLDALKIIEVNHESLFIALLFFLSSQFSAPPFVFATMDVQIDSEEYQHDNDELNPPDYANSLEFPPIDMSDGP